MKQKSFFIILSIGSFILAVVIFAVAINKWQNYQYVYLINDKSGQMEKVPVSEVYPQIKNINSSVNAERDRYRNISKETNPTKHSS